MMIAVAGREVPVIGCCGTEILQDMHPDRACPAAFVTIFFDALDQFTQVATFTQANLTQGFPDFRLEPHACPA